MAPCRALPSATKTQDTKAKPAPDTAHKGHTTGLSRFAVHRRLQGSRGSRSWSTKSFFRARRLPKTKKSVDGHSISTDVQKHHTTHKQNVLHPGCLSDRGSDKGGECGCAIHLLQNVGDPRVFFFLRAVSFETLSTMHSNLVLDCLDFAQSEGLSEEGVSRNNRLYPKFDFGSDLFTGDQT